MKEKVKNFFIEKKELLIFLAILALVFTSVILIAKYTYPREVPVNNTTNNTSTHTSVTTDTSSTSSNSSKTNIDIYYVMLLPISGEYEVVRTFFDQRYEEDLEKAVISNGSKFETSTGVSYAKKDNSSFEVVTIFSGNVVDVSYDELEGYTVKVAHQDDIYSIYSSLSSVSVEIGNTLDYGQTIGVSGTSILDNEAGVHVHLEILKGTEFINPRDAYDLTTSEIASGIK